ncbi:sugar phosphate isomerase/epimerase [Hoeflea sp. WL0058]|uniref:Sugar phosphate isomerase/epimerase n=1 Tax=Flavimaribacter sediminis TaxID=2865987 RepID=A0AAE2ZKF0_9HYPH|nr:sugar phosphate isomerase/epimerase family protein [Flavimaribacter sediminis]MBW8638148.1 sugar phosphate isomerase/epimerase [Flavimaribacter sediminis]
MTAQSNNESPDLLAAYWTIAGDVYPSAPSEISPHSVVERVEAAAEAGYRGVGLIHADLVHQAGLIGLGTMRNILDDHDMPHVELELLVDWFASGEKKSASNRMLEELCEAATVLGARDLKIAGDYDKTDIDIEKAIESFAAICETAKHSGVKIGLEIMPFSNVATLERGLEIVAGADHEYGGLVLDIWHMARGGASYEAVSRVPENAIVSVELSDADADVRGSLFEDTIHNRRLCGQGALDPSGFVEAIRKTGFDDFWSVEIISREHRRLPIREAAGRSFVTTMAQFQSR